MAGPELLKSRGDQSNPIQDHKHRLGSFVDCYIDKSIETFGAFATELLSFGFAFACMIGLLKLLTIAGCELP